MGGARSGLTNAMQKAASRGYLHTLRQVWVWEISEKALKAYKALHEDESQITEFMGDINEMAKTLNNTRMGSNTRTIFTVGTPCNKITKAMSCKPKGELIGPHVSPSNLMFTAAQAINDYARNSEGKGLVVIHEMTPAYSPAMELELDNLFGQKWEAKTGGASYNGHILAPRNRNYRIDPNIATNKEQTNIKIFQLRFTDGYRWPTLQEPLGSSDLPTIRTCIPSLIKRLHNPMGSNLGISDTVMLKSFQVQHEHNKDIRWMTPRHMGMLIGLKATDMDKLEKAFPCKGDIDTRLGKTRDDWKRENAEQWMSDAEFLSCGSKIFCQNCTELIEIIGSAWNIKSSEEVCDKALIALEEGRNCRIWPKTQPIHKCGNHCQLRKTKQQYDEMDKKRKYGSYEYGQSSSSGGHKEAEKKTRTI